MEKFTVIWENLNWSAAIVRILSDENIDDPESNTLIAEVELVGGDSHTETSQGHGFFWDNSNTNEGYVHIPFEAGRTSRIRVYAHG